MSKEDKLSEEEKSASAEKNHSKKGSNRRVKKSARTKKNSEPSDQNTLEKEIEELKAANEELKDKQLRLMAEFDNFRKRTAKERIELIGTASKDVISSLLEVLDDFERAQASIQKDSDRESVLKGLELVYNKFNTTLQARGLKAMDSIGKDFDPEFHEAITEIPAPDKSLKGKVIDTIEKGYTLNDKIIRYAKVVVGK